MRSALRFADDDDLIRFESSLDEIFPRRNAQGIVIRSWDSYHSMAMDDIARYFRSKRVYAEPFELGKIGIRSREMLRDAAACGALVWIFNQLNTIDGQPGGVYESKMDFYTRQRRDILDAESPGIDYDESGDGSIDAGEKQRPMTDAFLRG